MAGFWRIHPLTLTATLIGLASCGRSAIGDGNALTTLPSHTPAIVNDARPTGHASPDLSLRLRIALPLRNQAALDAFVTDIYDPQSAQFQQYLTPDQFAAAYHPDAASVAQVRGALQAAGMEVDEDAHGTMIGANASAAQA
jgi:kumamolisin